MVKARELPSGLAAASMLPVFTAPLVDPIWAQRSEGCLALDLERAHRCGLSDHKALLGRPPAPNPVLQTRARLIWSVRQSCPRKPAGPHEALRTDIAGARAIALGMADDDLISGNQVGSVPAFR